MRLSVILKVHPKLISLVYFLCFGWKSMCQYVGILLNWSATCSKSWRMLHAVVYASNVAFVGTLRFRHPSLYVHTCVISSIFTLISIHTSRLNHSHFHDKWTFAVTLTI